MSMVNKPKHYIGIKGLEVEEVLQNFMPKYKDGYSAHRAASAIEYILRSPEKNGSQDIEKAIRNLQQMMEHENSKPKTSYAEVMESFAKIDVHNIKAKQKVAIDTFYGGANLND